MKNIVVALLLTVIYSCAHAQMAESLDWLLGKWEITNEKGKLIEVWQKENDGAYSGKSYFVSTDNDTTLQEAIALEKRNDTWYYIPSVKDQNSGKPVDFKLVFLGKKEFIGENPAHDFPQRISYRRVASCLFASIEGVNNGKFKKQNFDYVDTNSSQLNGIWVPVKQEIGGNALPPAVFENQKLILESGTYTVIAESIDKGLVENYGNKIDIYSKDGVNAGKHFTAIYKYEDGLLTICYNLQGNSYPLDYRTDGKALFFLSVFRKQ